MKRTVLPILLLLVALTAGAIWLFTREPAAPQPAPAPAPAPAPITEKAVTLYFANREYVTTGDETQPHLLPEERKLKKAEAADPAAVLRALQAGPSSADAAPVIKSKIKILGVTVEKGVVYVDLARENLSGGSLEEVLLIDGVVKTLTGLPGITAVQFLVDGAAADTLMGHLEVDRPLKAEDVE